MLIRISGLLVLALMIMHNGRAWTANTVVEFLVGRLHGDYDDTQILL